MTQPLTLRYLGQAGFQISDGSRTLVIDPYLSDSVDRLEGFPPAFWRRNYPPPVPASALRHVQLVLCSHDHLDHADPETLTAIAQASPACRFAGPRQTVALFQSLGLGPDRTVMLDADQPFHWGPVTIEPVAAAHEDYEVDATGSHRFLGFLLRWNRVTLYHAGDTLATPQLSDRLARERIDLALLPVNGGDERRARLGIIGNMDVAAAAALADRHRFGLLVPMHYDLYPNNGLSPEALADAWSHQPASHRVPLKIVRPGQSFSWKPPR